MRILFWISHWIFLTLTLVVSVYCAYKMLPIFLEVKENIRSKVLLVLGFALLSHMVIFIGDLVNLIPSILIFLVCVCCCCRGSFAQKIAVGMIFSTMGFAFNALVDSYALFEFDIRICGRTLFWLALYLLARRYGPEKHYRLSASMWKLMILLTVTPLGIVLSVVLLSSSNTTTISGSVVTNFVLLVLALFSVIGLLWTIRVLSRQQKLEQENMLAEMNRRYYETMEQQQFEVRRLKHDMSNHLQTLTALPGEKQEEYLRELLDAPVFSQQINHCGDATVNAVLSAKAEEAAKRNIDFRWKLDIPEDLPYDKPDICALFANSLDNAMEACEKLPPNQRKISLAANRKKGLFVMKLINSCEEAARPPRAGETTKADKENHGYGLRSIREIVYRHGGSLEMTGEKGLFILFFYMPLEEIQE